MTNKNKKEQQATTETTETTETTTATTALVFTNDNATPSRITVTFRADGTAVLSGTDLLMPTFTLKDDGSQYFRTTAPLNEKLGLGRQTTYTLSVASEADREKLRKHNEKNGSKKGLNSGSIAWYKKDYATADGYALDLLDLYASFDGKDEDGKNSLRKSAFEAVAKAVTDEKPLEAVVKLRKDCEARETGRKAKEALTATTASLVEKLREADEDDKQAELRNLFTALGMSAEDLAKMLTAMAGEDEDEDGKQA